jgi:type II secretory pathway pseudopilin PulG
MAMEGRQLFSQYFDDKERIVIRKIIIKSEAGFTMVELIITMVVFVFVIAAASSVFTGLLTQFKQQSRIAETNVEGIVGLEIMRKDIEHAGFGLPWFFQSAITYAEPTSSPASTYNEPTNSVPRAIFTGNNVDYAGSNAYDGSDYLVIKGTNLAQNTVNTASGKWTTLRAAPFDTTTGCNPCNPVQWDSTSENLASTDRVIVLRPGTNDANAKTLIVDASGNFYTQFGSVTSSPWPPLDNTETRVIYGLTRMTSGTPVRPFNRADYFIYRPSTGMPSRCARPNIGILYKAVFDANGSTCADPLCVNFGASSVLPLLDCVADMQVVYALDNDEDGTFVDGSGTPPDGYAADISTLTAEEIRKRVKEVRVYILAHEGQKDPNFTYRDSTIGVPASPDPGYGLGRTFDFSTSGITDWQHYRWKVFTLVVRPLDLY